MNKFIFLIIFTSLQVSAELQLLQANDGAQKVIKSQLQNQTIDLDDPKTIFINVDKLAKSGDIRSQFSLGKIYEKGLGVLADQKLALYWYSQVAEKNYPSAQYKVATFYELGNGVKIDLDKAIEWYEKSAENVYGKAQYKLGELFLFGPKKYLNTKLGLTYLDKASKQNIPEAQITLAKIYLDGINVEANEDKAIYYLEQSAINHNDEAQFMLGDILLKKGSVSDGIKFLEKSSEQGNASAQLLLMKIYSEGKAIPSSLDRSFEYAIKASENNHPEAQFLLGKIYQDPKSKFFDVEKSFLSIHSSADQGYVPAQLEMARLLIKGQSVNQDIQKAMSWLDRAAKSGSSIAKYELANRYIYGQSLIRNVLLGLKLLKESAQGDYAPAQYLYSKLLDEGDIVVKDEQESFFWLDKAAKQGHQEASFALANKYLDAKSGNQAVKKAIKILEKLADNNHALSNFRLYEIFSNDIQGAKDSVKSRVYLFRAAELGYLKARYELGKIYYEQKLFHDASYWLELASSEDYEPAKNLLNKISSEKLSNEFGQNIPTSETIQSTINQQNYIENLFEVPDAQVILESLKNNTNLNPSNEQR